MRSSFILQLSAAALLMATALPLASVPAQAKSNFMTECSARYKAAKTNGRIDASTKWTDFMRSQCADLSATPQDTKPPPAAAAPTAAKAKPDAAKASNAFIQQCSAAWQKLKKSNAVPAGLKWGDFLKQNCTVGSAGEDALPAEPNSANAAAYQSIDVAKTDKNGKPFTPGQIAAHKRIKECASEWRTAKDNGSLPAGEKWPQFWSACNTRLKAQG